MTRETWQEREKSLSEYLEDREWLSWWWVYKTDWNQTQRDLSQNARDSWDETEDANSLLYLLLLIVAYAVILTATLWWPSSPKNYKNLPNNLSIKPYEHLVFPLY